ncbi:MAG: septum formation initiator family protein [Oscillospiraceae bacterium]|nr:septum formation initiator family protein [Oscillospiraceae bacterium]
MRKKTSFFTKVAFLVIFAFLTIQIIGVTAKLDKAARARAELRAEIARLEAINDDMEYKIEHSEDNEVIAQIARDDLGLLLPGEQVFS